MLRLFSPGPKSRTTAAYLAVFLGWAGIHKFYLARPNTGVIHVVLAGVGVMVSVVGSVAPASLVPASIFAWLVILIGYFYVRRVHLGHSIAQIISPGRLLLWPLRLLRYTFRLTGAGASMMGEEEEERRWRRNQRYRRRGGQRRRRRNDDDDDDDGGGCSVGMALMILGVLLSLAVAAAIVFVAYFVFSLVGFLAIAASITIGVIEGVLYFTKSEQRFQQEYVTGRRLWF